MVLWEVRITALDLHKALAADRLVAAPCLVQIWGVDKEANRTFHALVFIESNLKGLAINERVFAETNFVRRDVSL